MFLQFHPLCQYTSQDPPMKDSEVMKDKVLFVYYYFFFYLFFYFFFFLPIPSVTEFSTTLVLHKFF